MGSARQLTAGTSALQTAHTRPLALWRTFTNPHLVTALSAALVVGACSDPKPNATGLRTDDGGVDASVARGEETSTTASHESTNAVTSRGQTPTSTTAPPSTVNQTGTFGPTTTNTSSSPRPAEIKAHLSTPKAPGLELQAFRAGAASASNVDSLKYFIRSIQVCESLQPQGSGFQNPMGCLELYSGDQTALGTDLNGDLTPLADAARATSEGYVDLLSEASRETLTRSTVLEPQHVRTYNYGIITWALPVKVTATVTLGDGTNLFTHDGVTTSEIIGQDNFRNYFTRSETSLLQSPAEEAVVLLGNGGNWFKFQQGFEVTQADIDEGQNWVLDLVFNPDGIIKGYESAYVNGNLREEDDQGAPIRGVTVPMIDLVPVPHREADHVVRESYVANVDINGNGFDLRVELYSRENDPNHSVLGVDVKTLVTTATTEPPSEAAKVATVGTDDNGALRFGSFNDSPIIGGFTRLESIGESHRATFACATHADRAGAAGGALIVVSACPSPTIEVEFTLQARSRLDQSIPFPTFDPDAGINGTSEAASEDASFSGQPQSNDAATSTDAGVTDAPADAGMTDASDASPDVDGSLDASSSP